MKRELYPKDWRAISRAIRERSGGACECSGQCGAAHDGGRCGTPNGKLIVRDPLAPERWYGLGDCLIAETGTPAWIAGRAARATRVVLTVAHLDHDPSHNDPANLAALCQRCHLVLDRHQHATNARARRRGRRAAGDLPGTEVSRG